MRGVKIGVIGCSLCANDRFEYTDCLNTNDKINQSYQLVTVVIGGFLPYFLVVALGLVQNPLPYLLNRHSNIQVDVITDLDGGLPFAFLLLNNIGHTEQLAGLRSQSGDPFGLLVLADAQLPVS